MKIKNSTISIFAIILVSATILMANTYMAEINTEIAEKEIVAATEETEPMPGEEAFEQKVRQLSSVWRQTKTRGRQPLSQFWRYAW